MHGAGQAIGDHDDRHPDPDCLICGIPALGVWAVNNLGTPEPLRRIVYVLIVVVAVLIVLGLVARLIVRRQPRALPNDPDEPAPDWGDRRDRVWASLICYGQAARKCAWILFLRIREWKILLRGKSYLLRRVRKRVGNAMRAKQLVKENNGLPDILPDISSSRMGNSNTVQCRPIPSSHDPEPLEK